jgi:outer membrane protein
MPRFSRLAALTLSLLLPCQMAHAEVKIAVVNMQAVMNDSTAVKSIRQPLESKRKIYHAEISKQDSELQKTNIELQKQQSALAKDVFESKFKALQAQATALREESEGKKRILENAASASDVQVQKAFGEIIADLAKEKGFNVALPSMQTLYADPTLDITADVTKRLNEKMPNYTVKFDAPKEAPKADKADKADKK